MAGKYTPFTPMNFPARAHILNSGTRTQYPVKPEYNDKGFLVGEDTQLIDDNGKNTIKVSAGSLVYFMHPVKLMNGSELAQRSGYWASVSTKSANSRPDGYINVSRVIKPAGSSQARVAAGSETQKNVALEIQRLVAAQGKDPPEKISEAKPGSTAPDLVMRLSNGKDIQFEIKGTNSLTAPITLFDKSVSRKRGTPDPIDDLAMSMLPDNLKATIRRSGYPLTFVGTIDYFRSIDTTDSKSKSRVGLAGDEGTVSSGKIPQIFTTTNTATLTAVRKTLIEKFRKGGDDYFVIEDRSTKSFKIYFVGPGSDVLGVPQLPPLKFFSLDTYGGASSGSTRVGLKIRI